MPGPVDRRRRTCFRPFTNVGGHAGIFISGARPAWLFVSPKGGLRAHAMRSVAKKLTKTIGGRGLRAMAADAKSGRGRGRCRPSDGGTAVVGFSPFHNVNCPRGLVYIGEQVRGSSGR